MLKQQLDRDLKTALLAGDKTQATIIRGLKSVILYAEVAKGNRDTGLGDEEIVALFAKEAKKRQESAELYAKAGDKNREEVELSEKAVIEGYLPAQLSDDELLEAVNATLAELGLTGMQALGQVIAAVKEKVGASADGARIARLAKERLQK